MRNVKLTLAYDGTEFSGWQIQPGLSTIQGTLASAIGRITGENVLPQGSGRTDAGVHALAQVATFTTDSVIPAANLITALNDTLPPTIRVMEATEVALDFHARKSARAKTYRYRIYRYHLDEGAMIQAAALVEGERDFTSFAAVDPERREDQELRSNIRHVLSSRWRRDDDELVYAVKGNGFLHHMVRNLVGTFILVGKRTLTSPDLTRILEARNRSTAGATAPASGLYLVSVDYDDASA